MRTSVHQPPAGMALREAHAHVFQHGRSMGMVRLAGCSGAEEMLDRVGERAGETGPGGCVLADGARPEAWPDTDTGSGWPTLAELDRRTGDTPCCCWCFDYHALMANSAMLAIAGIGPGTADPAGGIIGRDARGGLTGVVYESAALAVWGAVPEPADADRAAIVRTALEDLARHGFTEVHDLKSQRWLGPVAAPIAAELGMPLVLYPLMEDLPAALASRDTWEGEHARLGGGKIFVDGTLNSRTAWMLEPYADGRPDYPRGTPMVSEAEISAAVRTCVDAGVGLAAHAIGDAAVRAVLDAIMVEDPPAAGGSLWRHRIEHAELVHPADLPRFAELGVVCSVQPCHMLYDIEALGRAVPDRLDRVLPLRSLIDSGLEPGRGLIFGSDTPIVRPDPGDSLQAAVERRRAGDDVRNGAAEASETVIGAAEAISADEALACFAAR